MVLVDKRIFLTYKRIRTAGNSRSFFTRDFIIAEGSARNDNIIRNDLAPALNARAFPPRPLEVAYGLRPWAGVFLTNGFT